MRRKPHPKEDGFRVWMNGEELDQLIKRMEERQGTPGAVAGRLGRHCGLRREEATDACATDVQDTTDDPVLRVPEGKSDKYRETPIPADLADETGDPGWTDVTYHDLRRTWGTRCLEQGMLPSVVMWFGGWDDWDTFRKHYLGEFSPGALQRERRKVPWLADGATIKDSQVFARTPAPTTSNPTTTHESD